MEFLCLIIFTGILSLFFVADFVEVFNDGGQYPSSFVLLAVSSLMKMSVDWIG